MDPDLMKMSAELTLEELKVRKQKFEEINEESFKSLKKLNEILIEKLETGVPVVSDRTKKLKELILKLSELINDKIELSKSTEAKHEKLKSLYYEQKAKYESEQIGNKEEKEKQETEPAFSAEELQEAQAERDKALGLVKILLATLKSSRMQSEENYHKLKHSADLMFHIMYKAEDTFLGGEEEAQ